MRIRLPEDCCGLVHDGRPLAIGADRTVDVESDVAALLACHGAVPVADRQPLARSDPRKGTR